MEAHVWIGRKRLCRCLEPSEPLAAISNLGPVGNTDTAGTRTRATDVELAALAEQMTSAYQGSINVAYTLVDGRDYADTATFEGGYSLGTCTGGFTAQERSTQIYGIITAGHCLGDLTLNGFTLPWVKGYPSVQVDAQLRKVPSSNGHTLTSDLICSQYEPYKCTLNGDISRYNMRGQIACHTGKSTGTSCGTVDNIYFRPVYYRACLDAVWGLSVQCHKNFVRVNGSSLRQCFGDSGGPWFRRNIAYGIHKGGTDGDNCEGSNKVAWFSGIREVENFLNVDILVRRTVTWIGSD